MPPKKSKLYKMPAPLPKNEILTDMTKQKWILGPSIGKGGFGEVYSAASGETVPSKDAQYSYVVKVEPFLNGPLFLEKTIYLRIGKEKDVQSWMEKNKYKTFGMPVSYGSGSHTCDETKYRFLVLDRYSKDLQTLFESCNRLFPLSTALQVSIQILDVLEYIHSTGYVHADIKGANLLLGMKKGTENQVYLVDFGLAAHFSSKLDPKKAHNGTIEYTSRDAHAGGTTRRGDIEILAYNMVHWLSSKLPWEGVKDCVAVQKAKESAMQNLPTFLKTCFGKRPIPDVLMNFLKYVSLLQLDEAPDYMKIRNIFLDGLKKEGVKFGSALSFTKPLEEQNGESKKGQSSRKARGTSKAAQFSSSETENIATSSRMIVDESDEEDTKPSKRKGSSKPAARRGAKKAVQLSSASEDSSSEDLFQSDEEEETKQKKRKVSAKAKPAEKVSWRDCQTVKVSRVERPGEFVPLKPKLPKKGKK